MTYIGQKVTVVWNGYGMSELDRHNTTKEAGSLIWIASDTTFSVVVENTVMTHQLHKLLRIKY